MKKIIVINGAGIGKYKFLDKLNKFRDFTILSSVTKVKEISKMLGWDDKTLNEKDRKLISDIKDAYTNYNNGPINDIINGVENSSTDLNIVLSREKNDNEQLKNIYKDNIKFVHFSRVGVSVKFQNHADQGIYDYNYDKVMLVFNNSIDSNIKEFLELIDSF